MSDIIQIEPPKTQRSPHIKSVDMWFEYMGPISNPPQRGLGDMYQQACSSDRVTIEKWHDIWINQTKANFDKFGPFHKQSIAEIYETNMYKPAIVVGSGPSLAKNVKTLATVTDIPIISCLHNFHYLHDHGVKTKYFVNLDAGEVTIEEMWEGGSKTAEEYIEATKDYTLLAYIGTHPKLLNLWKGKVLFFTNPIPDTALQAKVREISPLGPQVSSGGNVLGACMYIAKIMGSNPVIFTGADFAFSYTRKFHPWDSKYDADVGVAIRSIDVYGCQVLSWSSYFNFKLFTEFVCMTVPGIWINCTEGGTLGAYPEGNLSAVRPLDLAYVLEMYQLPKYVRDQSLEPSKPSSTILY